MGNYAITYVNGTFTITAKPATVTAADATKVYGAGDPGLTASENGFLAGDTAGITLTATRAAGENVGPYVITPSASGGNVGNYAITYVNGTFTITAKPATVTAADATKVYGAGDPGLTASENGFLAGDTAGITLTATRAAGENVGPYVITPLATGGNVANYAITYVNGTFTITPKAASVTPDPGTKVYGAIDPALTGTLVGFLPADGVTATYSRAAGETVLGGPYTISALLSPAPVLNNYTITYNTAAFTISKKSASVAPSAGTKTYGAADPTLTGTLSGFVTADGVTATYSRTPGETVAGSPYTISAVLNAMPALDNYTITYATANFTITAKAASVTPNAATKAYGAADPALSGSLSGFLPADGVTAAYSRAAGETVAGGPYAISAVLTPAGRARQLRDHLQHGQLHHHQGQRHGHGDTLQRAVGR